MCDNDVEYYVPMRFDYVMVKVTCGSTDPHGNRAICEACQDNPQVMEQIRQEEAAIAADNASARSAGWGEF
jgi:hypothetical protein|tara:strand:+ start:1372 stop:1584 length:213 start_codon:yes stop_codon:yes gene_type:complete